MLLQHSSAQDPCTPITLGQPSVAPQGAEGFCGTPGCGTIITKLKALGA